MNDLFSSDEVASSGQPGQTAHRTRVINLRGPAGRAAAEEAERVGSLVYIGRRVQQGRGPGSRLWPASPWGNPFRGEDWRERYRAHVLSRPDLVGLLPTLGAKTLACWCKPRDCHGDVLLELLAELDARVPPAGTP
jgi:hypothetical protein